MLRINPFNRLPLYLVSGALWILTAAMGVLAAAPSLPGDGQVSHLVDREKGEGEQIRKREQWFLSTRRAGVTSDEEMARLRREGVDATRIQLKAQRQRKERGVDAELNFWVEMGPAPSHFGGWSFGDVAGRVAAIAHDPDLGVLYVGTAAGGLWKSTNDGLSYISIMETAGTLAAGAIAVDPNDSNTLWVGTGDNVTGCSGYFGLGLMRSTDGGSNWEYRNGSAGNDLEDLSSFANVIVDPRDSSHLVAGGRIRGCQSGVEQSGALFTTNDAGATWTKRITSLSIYEIVQDPSVQDVWWAATQDGVFKSIDNAVSWTLQAASGLPNGGTGRTELAVSPSDSNTVYALFYSPNEFWRTTDGGASWQQMSTGTNACDGQCSYNMVLRVHRTDPNTVYRGTVHIFKSTDGGINWTDLSNNWGSAQTVHQDTHVLVMDRDNPDSFYVGCDGGVWKSEDAGSTFANLNGNLNSVQFYAIGVDNQDTNSICGGAQDNSSLARTTSNTWDLQAVTGDGFVCHIDPSDSNISYITSYPSGGYPSVSRSETGILGSYHGITKSGSGIANGDRINWVTPYVPDPRQPSTLYLGTHRVYRSDDRGDNWVHVGPEDMTANSGSLLTLDVNPNFNDTVLAGSASGRVWRTTSGGADWIDITAGLPSRSINDLASDPTDPDRAFATVGGFNTGHLWEWTLAGGWVERGAELPNVPANSVLMVTGEDIYVGMDTGVFRSVDGGLTFEPYMNGLAEGMVVMDMKYTQSESLITAGTYGRGAWQVSIDPVGAIVLYDSIELPMIEIDGDGDEHVEPGETWAVRPRLRNAGGEIAVDVQARLASSTPGITILEPQVHGFGSINPGETAASVFAYEFTVAPDFACGEEISFDLVEITSVNDPGSYSDRIHAFTVTVVDSYEAPAVTTLVDEDFEGGATGWTHEAVTPSMGWECYGQYYRDEWMLASRDAGHGTSYHQGQGPGQTHLRTDYAWLYAVGKDSAGDAGLDLPGNATTITLTLTHWYQTNDGQDGGQVLIDGSPDGADGYSALKPAGGYPGTALAIGNCNGLEGRKTFSGDSGGWRADTFDLTAYRGKKIYLAFVFGSDKNKPDLEGWTIDQVIVESSVRGAPICQVIDWPGRVPASASFLPAGGGDIRASWSPSCNADSLTGQAYAIHSGTLDDLAGGNYIHAPVGGICSRVSPATFTPGITNEYYLVVPNEGGHQGGAGADSSGNSRPQADVSCGEPREAACP